MANNLMWLIHKPTGLGILLAKHAGLGWFNPSDSGAAYPDVLFERVDLERGIQCEDWTDYTIGFSDSEPEWTFIQHNDDGTVLLKLREQKTAGGAT